MPPLRRWKELIDYLRRRVPDLNRKRDTAMFPGLVWGLDVETFTIAFSPFREAAANPVIFFDKRFACSALRRVKRRNPKGIRAAYGLAMVVPDPANPWRASGPNRAGYERSILPHVWDFGESYFQTLAALSTRSKAAVAGPFQFDFQGQAHIFFTTITCSFTAVRIVSSQRKILPKAGRPL